MRCHAEYLSRIVTESETQERVKYYSKIVCHVFEKK